MRRGRRSGDTLHGSSHVDAALHQRAHTSGQDSRHPAQRDPVGCEDDSVRVFGIVGLRQQGQQVPVVQSTQSTFVLIDRDLDRGAADGEDRSRS